MGRLAIWFSFSACCAFAATDEAAIQDTFIKPWIEAVLRTNHRARVELAASRGSWYEVFSCPNEKGMEFLRKQMADGAEQKRKAAQLASELKDPLLSELKELLAQQRKLDAVKKYQQAAGVDLTTAVTVINALQQSKP